MVKKLPVIVATKGNPKPTIGWQAGGLLNGDGTRQGLKLSRIEAEEFYAYIRVAADQVARNRAREVRRLGRFVNAVFGRETAYVSLSGQYVGLVFRALASPPLIKLSVMDHYRLKFEVVELALRVMEQARDEAIINEPHSVRKEQSFVLGLLSWVFLGPIITYLAGVLFVRQQNAKMLEKYGGTWPEKIRTQATQEQIDQLEKLVLN
ncbi:hypothetical protein AAFO92_02925 [Roseovarius sp. CAU 1744]|uniref:hypothetical protein n=1 Tax=Roseovarius sp. CAU 1744 TaxID=3140368 RepID=UPI00325B4DE2